VARIKPPILVFTVFSLYNLTLARSAKLTEVDPFFQPEEEAELEEESRPRRQGRPRAKSKKIADDDFDFDDEEDDGKKRRSSKGEDVFKSAKVVAKIKATITTVLTCLHQGILKGEVSLYC
jgi:hypothetical protein